MALKPLLLAGVAALVLLSGCDKPKQEEAVKIYSSVEECKTDHTEDQCQKAFNGAKDYHDTTAPHQATLGECVDKYGAGACIPHHDSSGDWFGPAMAGFMIGHMLGAPTYQPVYIYHGYAYSGSNQLGSWRSGGYVSVPRSSTWSHSYTTTRITPTTRGPSGSVTYAPAPSRGGFGGSASSIGKASPSGPSSVAAPSASSARGGFGGSISSGMSSGG